MAMSSLPNHWSRFQQKQQLSQIQETFEAYPIKNIRPTFLLNGKSKFKFQNQNSWFLFVYKHKLRNNRLFGTPPSMDTHIGDTLENGQHGQSKIVKIGNAKIGPFVGASTNEILFASELSTARRWIIHLFT